MKRAKNVQRAVDLRFLTVSAGCSEVPPDYVTKDKERKVKIATLSVSLLEAMPRDGKLLYDSRRER